MESPSVLPVHHGRAADRRRGHVVKLPPEARSVPSARAQVTRVLHDWGFDPPADDVALTVSELVTNAVKASARPLHDCLSARATWLVVAVADAGPRYPARSCPDSDAESGRGLLVVEALSARWGWHPVALPGLTKVVWAEFQTPDVSRADAASRGGGEPVRGT